MVHPVRSVVVLQHTQFISRLGVSCNSISIITNCTYAITSHPNTTTYVNNLFTFIMSVYYV